MRLDKAARSILLTEFVSAFFLAMRYFFKPKATLNYPFEKRRQALRSSAMNRTILTVLVFVCVTSEP